MNIKLFIIICIIISFGICGSTYYKTFPTLETALDFIAFRYKDANDNLGGNAWWASHKIIVIPHLIKYNQASIESISNSYVVYWHEKHKLLEPSIEDLHE